MPLIDEHAQHLKPGTPPLSVPEAEELLKETPGWTLKDKSIEREYKFDNFRQAIDFVNKVADIVDPEDHHPDIYISYNLVRLAFSTHKIGGLSRNDFIMAAKVSSTTE